MSAEQLQEKTVAELRNLARESGHKGAAILNLSKAQLVSLLLTGEMPAAAAKQDSGNLAEIIAAAVSQYVQAPAINESTVKEIIRAEIAKTSPAVQVVEVKRLDGSKVNVGLAHKSFEEFLNVVGAGLHVWLYGEAGSGKTHVAHQVAKALNLDFFPHSFCSQSTKSDLIGFIDATGTYHTTAFRRAYEFGGLFLGDEIDNANPNILNVLNAALANEGMCFPDGYIKRHENFRAVAAANTIGDGPNRKYVGRNAIDLATKSRFVFVEFNTDWKLVKALTGNDGVFEWMSAVRLKAESLNLENVQVTSRTMEQAAKLQALGFSKANILNMVFLKGCDETTKGKFQEFAK